jgi:hypothetical protein
MYTVHSFTPVYFSFINKSQKVFRVTLLLITFMTFAVINNSNAQIAEQIGDLKLEFNSSTSVYSIHLRSDQTITEGTLFFTQISLVLPSSLTLSDLTILNSIEPTGNNWFVIDDAQEPASDIDHDFVSIQNGGGLITLAAGDWQTLFEFSLTGGCQSGVRLFDNLNDPKPSDAGMNGVEFDNFLYFYSDGWFVNIYRSNKAGDTEIVFVNDNASGDNSGNSWNNAVPTLSQALNDRACWKTQFWVAEGHYLPTQGSSRTSSFGIPAGISIYGGFLGDETDLDNRQGSPMNTILSGNIGDPETSSDNSYNVIRIRNQGAIPCVIDGFLITDGQADHPSTGNRQRGGGIHVANSHVIINNCVTTNNLCTRNGAGVYAFNSTVNIKDLESSLNYAGNHGSGLFVNNSSLILSTSSFKSNTANARGGGMYIASSSAIMERIEIQENESNLGGGAYFTNITGGLYQALLTQNSAYNDGCAIYVHNGQPFNIVNTTMAQNLILVQQAALKISGNSDVSLQNSILWNEGEEIESAFNDIFVAFSNIEGGYPGVNVTDNEPEFEDYDDFHLSNSSPLLNKGVAQFLPDIYSADLDGNPRIVGITLDLGPYENQTGGDQNRLARPHGELNIRIYPNPVVSSCNISCDQLENKNWMIINNQGVVVAKGKSKSILLTLNTDDYSKGMYHFILFDEQHHKTKSFIKI